MSSALGVLWIVATPLGNPGDLSSRAKSILESASIVLAEDTRRAGQLFGRCGLQANGFVSLHEHNEAVRIPWVLERLQAGESIALISDAGTPLLSDPGYQLVRACRQAGLKVSPVPGPSAPIAALSASGFPPIPFVFLGFLSRKRSEQEETWVQMRAFSGTCIFFERKDRLRETLAVAYSILGDREVCLAREVTKTYEEFVYFSLANYADVSVSLLGELTILIAPAEKNARLSEDEIRKLIQQELVSGGKAKDIARRVQQHSTGWSSKEIYQVVLREQHG